MAVFERDGHRCRVCGAGNCRLDAHHVTNRNEMPNGGYVAENGITLCDTCHEKAEVWHASRHTHAEPRKAAVGEAEPGYAPDELYALIGSSWEIAWEASERLV